MKKLFLFCAVLICAAATVQAEHTPEPFQIAKAVKLGRNINATTSHQSKVNLQSGSEAPELAKECDANCKDCDRLTGKCLLCASGRYISGNLCLSCPQQNYCDGQTAVPNCTDVSCLVNAVAEATDTGCCCMPLGCEGVSCKTGYSPVLNANGCCCV